jgi:hypothetical protein
VEDLGRFRQQWRYHLLKMRDTILPKKGQQEKILEEKDLK